MTTDSSAKRRTLAVRNPRTGTVDFEFEPASAADVAAVATRLRAGQKAWGAAPLEHRIAVLRRWADLITANSAEIGAADLTDTGFCHTSLFSPHIVTAMIRGWCDDAPQILAQAHVSGPSLPMPQVQIRSQLKAYPLLGVISPWNAPLMLSLMDAIPALVAGSAAMIKPSEVAPRFAEPLMKTVRQVPELAAVLDYIRGDGETGQAMIEHADLICFTGSVPNGRKVAEACARRFIPAFLELGGKDPVIVTASADLERATTSILRGAVYATGQVCYSIERLYVHESIHDAFVAKLAAKAEQVQLNYPDPRQGQIGPFIFPRQAQIVDSHLDDALAKGAKIVTGGKSENLGGGLYMRPTVLTGVTHDMLIMRDETFGPVMPVMKYRTEEEAVALANDTSFGLSAAVLAGSDEEGLRIAEQIDAGGVSVQDTFLTFAKLRRIGTHSFKLSGMGGSRTGPESIMRFLRRKALLLNSGAPADIMDSKPADVAGGARSQPGRAA